MKELFFRRHLSAGMKIQMLLLYRRCTDVPSACDRDAGSPVNDKSESFALPALCFLTTSCRRTTEPVAAASTDLTLCKVEMSVSTVCSLKMKAFRSFETLVATVRCVCPSIIPFYCFRGWDVGRGSSVGIATRYGLDGPGIESRWRRDFPHPSRPALRPTQPPIQWVPGLSRGKRPGLALNTPPPL